MSISTGLESTFFGSNGFIRSLAVDDGDTCKVHHNAPYQTFAPRHAHRAKNNGAALQQAVVKATVAVISLNPKATALGRCQNRRWPQREGAEAGTTARVVAERAEFVADHPPSRLLKIDAVCRQNLRKMQMARI